MECFVERILSGNILLMVEVGKEGGWRVGWD